MFKGLLITLVSFLSVHASAEVIVNSSSFQPVSGQSTTTMQQVGGDTSAIKYNFTEGGFQMSSLNDGTLSATIALIHEFENGVGVGARGSMPMQFSNDTQVYTGSFLARFMLLNEANKMYLEPTLSLGIYNGETYSESFLLGGLGFGYLREVNRDFSVGANIGVDISNKRVADNNLYSSDTIYNKIGVMGNYYF